LLHAIKETRATADGLIQTPLKIRSRCEGRPNADIVWGESSEHPIDYRNGA